MHLTYKHTLYACYAGYITQAAVNNLAPLLFIVFQTQFSLSFEMVGRLILINFGTQLLADVLAVKFVDKIGYRASAILAHALCTVGLVLLGVLPRISPSPYAGLIFAVITYALGGGLLEVLVSPIADSLPGDKKASAMSLLHSFYCWGQVAVVLISTLALAAFGTEIWMWLPIGWALLPLCNLFFFTQVPLMPPVPEEKLMSIGELCKSRVFLVSLLVMMCAGASELTMSQWSSLFAETGLGVSKTLGDLLGPCLFAALMGLGRLLYGVYGAKLNLRNALLCCGALCAACYALTIFAPHPLLSLVGCALCGFSVSVMWPGTFSDTAARFPRGGTAMFGMMAVFGDLGASLGPWISGVVSDFSQQTSLLQQLQTTTGQALSQLGMKAGLLAGMLFPALLILCVLYLKSRRARRAMAGE